jgi:hypothetical protein
MICTQTFGLLEDLHLDIRDGGRPGPVVIAVDGAGASTVVLRFAHSVAEEFPDGQVFLDLCGDMTARDALRWLVRGLGGLPGTVESLASAYRTLSAGRRLLVVLDNVRDPSQVRPLLPDSTGSLVLITSRHPLTGLAASDGACMVEFEALSQGYEDGRSADAAVPQHTSGEHGEADQPVLPQYATSGPTRVFRRAEPRTGLHRVSGDAPAHRARSQRDLAVVPDPFDLAGVRAGPDHEFAAGRRHHPDRRRHGLPVAAKSGQQHVFGPAEGVKGGHERKATAADWTNGEPI